MADDWGRSDEREGGSDFGTDRGRDFGDEPPPAYRDAPPDILGPIDDTAPVSGHVPGPQPSGVSASMTPEHDWAAASAVVVPVLRPVGTAGLRIDEVDRAVLAENANEAHTLPLLGDAPCGLAIAYALPATGFDVIVNGEHLLSWNVEPGEVHAAALANLAAWSAGADWEDEASGERRLLSSDTGSSCPRSAPISPPSSRPAAGSSSGCPIGTCCWPARSGRATTTSPGSCAST